MSGLLLWTVCCAALCFGSTACGQPDPGYAASAIAVDDFGDTLRLDRVPQRIVSLTPASTELVFALGAGSRLVGRTRWDAWPDSARFVPDLGDGLRPNVESVLGARPDLVLIYASSENRRAAERLRAAGVQTLSLKVDTPEHFARLARILGVALRDTVTANAVVDTVMRSLASVRELTSSAQRPSVLWIADLEPLIAIGGGSFLSELIEIAGGRNAYEFIMEPSAPIALEDVLRRNPEVIIGSQRVVDHVRDDHAWSSVAAVRAGRLLVADSYLMGRPSVRLGEAARELARLIHPEVRR